MHYGTGPRSTNCSYPVLEPWHFGTDPDADSDPYLWLTDPVTDPDIFVSDIQDANKNKYFFLKFLSYSFLNVH